MASPIRTETKKDEPAELTAAWQDHVNSVLKSRDFAMEQMKANRKQVERLDREYKEMAIRTGYILKEMQNAITIYSQLLCRPFCEQIHKRLPRELRNHIYGYLLGPRPAKPVPRLTLIKQRRREIWFSESWVGRQFTIEICEMAYRTDNLQLCGSSNIADLLLLPEDNGVLPIAHMRSLVLKIDLLHRTCMSRCCYPGPPPPPPPFPPFQLNELRDSLEALHKIKRKSGFRLDIKISSGDLDPPLLKDALDAMKPVVLRLKAEGMKITICYELYIMHTNRYPDNLMVYYEESLEWDEMVKAHRDKLKADGVELEPLELVSPPLFPMNLGPPPPPAPWQPNVVVPLPNPPMAAISVAHPVVHVVEVSNDDDRSDAGSESGGSDAGGSVAGTDTDSESNADGEEDAAEVNGTETNEEREPQPEVEANLEVDETPGKTDDPGPDESNEPANPERADTTEVESNSEADTPQESGVIANAAENHTDGIGPDPA